jgi:hypothetical protein
MGSVLFVKRVPVSLSAALAGVWWPSPVFNRLLLFLRLLIFAAFYAWEKQRMARNRYVGTKKSLVRTTGSTVKIEPVGLSTCEGVERRIVTVIGS